MKLKFNTRKVRKNGFSLLVLVVMVSSLVAVASSAFLLQSGSGDEERAAVTRQRYNAIEKGLLGPERDITLNGVPVQSGFVSDMGGFPQGSLGALVDRGTMKPWSRVGSELLDKQMTPEDYASFQEVISQIDVLDGWRGPYAPDLEQNASVATDGWGNPFIYSTPNPNDFDKSAQLFSGGKDGADDSQVDPGADLANEDFPFALSEKRIGSSRYQSTPFKIPHDVFLILNDLQGQELCNYYVGMIYPGLDLNEPFDLSSEAAKLSPRLRHCSVEAVGTPPVDPTDPTPGQEGSGGSPGSDGSDGSDGVEGSDDVEGDDGTDATGPELVTQGIDPKHYCDPEGTGLANSISVKTPRFNGNGTFIQGSIQVTDPYVNGVSQPSWSSEQSENTFNYNGRHRHQNFYSFGEDRVPLTDADGNVIAESATSGAFLMAGTPRFTNNSSDPEQAQLLADKIVSAGGSAGRSYEYITQGETPLRQIITNVDPPASIPQPIRPRITNSSPQRHFNGVPAALAPGDYLFVTTSSTGTITLGEAGKTDVSVYNIGRLGLNGGKLEILSPVQIRMFGSMSVDGSFGATDKPEWLEVHLTSWNNQPAHFNVNSNSLFWGSVINPSGETRINSGAALVGSAVSDRIILNSNSRLVNAPSITNAGGLVSEILPDELIFRPGDEGTDGTDDVDGSEPTEGTEGTDGDSAAPGSDGTDGTDGVPDEDSTDGTIVKNSPALVSNLHPALDFDKNFGAIGAVPHYLNLGDLLMETHPNGKTINTRTATNSRYLNKPFARRYQLAIFNAKQTNNGRPAGTLAEKLVTVLPKVYYTHRGTSSVRSEGEVDDLAAAGLSGSGLVPPLDYTVKAIKGLSSGPELTEVTEND